MGEELERRRWWDSVTVRFELYCAWSINILDLLLTMRPIQSLCERARKASATGIPSVSNETHASLNGAYHCPTSCTKLPKHCQAHTICPLPYAVFWIKVLLCANYEAPPGP